MRWSDLPAEGGPVEQPRAWPSARLAELQQRLERLPQGHPSAPDWTEPEPGEPDFDAADFAGQQPASEVERVASDGQEPVGSALGDPQPSDLEPGWMTHGERDPEASAPQNAEANELGFGDARLAGRGPGDAGLLGHDLSGMWPLGRAPSRPGPGSPYRPWFTDADWSEPWFTGDIF